MTHNNEFKDKKYHIYHDYNFRSILMQRANGLLKFLGIPYVVLSIMLSEFTSLGPTISRIDFAAEVDKNGKIISFILECQSQIPTDEDIKRFFQYVASLRNFKNNNVELFILCTQRVGYTKKEFIINDECTYTMHVISLKNFRAMDIFKKIENKLKNNVEITEEDIASIQVIVYTDFEESEFEILNRARKLLEEIADKSGMDINEKSAVIYLFDVLSTNMLSDDEYEQYMEENVMLINPVERYCVELGRKEGIEKGIEEGKLEDVRKMVEEGFSVDVIVRITGLPEDVVLREM